jgi:hypothetical protein
MSKNDDELNEFIDEVTAGTYNLPCVEVIFKLGNQIQSKESSPMMRHIQEIQVVYCGWKVGRRQGTEEVVVI